MLELVYLILQMPRGDTRQAATEDGAEEPGEKVIDRKRGRQLEGRTGRGATDWVCNHDVRHHLSAVYFHSNANSREGCL